MATIDREATVRATWVARVEEARGRDALLVLHGYCQQPDCAGRQVRVFTKDYDRTLVASVRRRGLRCPICGHVLTLHSVQTSADERAHTRQAARCSVNEQRYERDHVEPGAVVLVPASVLLDDRLPE